MELNRILYIGYPRETTRELINLLGQYQSSTEITTILKLKKKLLEKPIIDIIIIDISSRWIDGPYRIIFYLRKNYHYIKIIVLSEPSPSQITFSPKPIVIKLGVTAFMLTTNSTNFIMNEINRILKE